MLAYIARRLLLIVPTLLGILLLNFVIVQAAPGGPVEQLVSELTRGSEVTGRFSGATSEVRPTGGNNPAGGSGGYQATRGLDPQLVQDLRKQFGFDQPAWRRFVLMVGNYLTFDLGDSFFSNRPVAQLVIEKLPVSISLGVWTTLITYLISIPLGIRKAVRDGTRFDVWTSSVIVVAYAIPSFLFALLLIVLFAGGSYFQIFPLRGIVSDNWHQLDWPARILDYLWHMALPVFAMVLSGFASLTMLTKNSFLDQIGQQYVVTARAKGLTEHQVLYGHVFRNAMLIVIAGFPAAFVGILFTGALLIETIFSLDGLGLLSFQAALRRDYPVMFGTLYVFTLIGLLLKLASDLTYILVDPRIDFESRQA
jgi:microcin C transport system permease protein